MLLSIPVACIAWTVTHEEVFREPGNGARVVVKGVNHFLNASFFICSPVNTVLVIMWHWLLFCSRIFIC